MQELLIAKILKRNKKTIAVAESCTGGLLSHSLTNIPGSSEFFGLGIVAYSPEMKVSILKIPKNILRSKGIISKEVALLMAKNIRKIANSDFGIGVTGIAGPSGGTKKTPVGTVYISVVRKDKSITKKFFFKGGRISIKKKTKDSAFKLLRECL